MEEDSRLVQIDEVLDIDCEKGDLNALTDYLIQHVEGFDTYLYQVELVNNSLGGKNYYTISYGMQINGFKTPNKVMVFIEDDKIQYAASFSDRIDEFVSVPATIEKSSIAELMEKAKKIATEDISADAMLDYQEVKKIIDENLEPLFIVKTVCMDEQGARFVLNHEYSLKRLMVLK